jgi:hypothetical protein
MKNIVVVDDGDRNSNNLYSELFDFLLQVDVVFDVVVVCVLFVVGSFSKCMFEMIVVASSN